MAGSYPVPLGLSGGDHDKALHDLLGIDHGLLTGTADDDHPQYLDAGRHDARDHNALGLDHGGLGGLLDDDHTQYLTTTRHTGLAGGHVTNADSHNHSGGDGAQIDHGGLSGLGDDDHAQYLTTTRHTNLTGDHVTNGNSHNHSGGDGGQIDHGGLAGLSDDDHPQYALLAYVDSGDAAPDVDMQVYGTGANSSTFDATFQDVASTTYTIPAGWNTYMLKVRGWTMAANLTDGDVVETAVVIASNAGTIVGDNANTKSRTLTAAKVSTGLSSTVTVALRARNTSGTRGTSFSAWLDLIAVRTS